MNFLPMMRWAAVAAVLWSSLTQAADEAVLELLRESVLEVDQAEEYTPLHVRAASSVRLVPDDEEVGQQVE